MKRKKGIHTPEVAHLPHVERTPPRVAPRLKTEVKRMRVRSKKNSLGGKK